MYGFGNAYLDSFEAAGVTPQGNDDSSARLSYWDQFVEAGVTPQGWGAEAQPRPVYRPASGGTSLTSWLNANALTVGLGVGGVVLLMMLAKGGR